MATTAKAPAAFKVPKARGRLKWRPVFVAVVLCATIGSAEALILSSAPLRKTHSFAGALSRKNKLVPVTVPNGARILTVLVKEGEDVEIGQTIALLDALPLETELAELARSTYRERLALACLKNIGAFHGELADQPAQFLSDEDKNALAQEMADACALRHARLAVAQEDTRVTIATLQERARLIERAISVNSQFALPSDGAKGSRNAGQLRRQIELSLAANLVREELIKARTVLRDGVNAQEENRLAELRDIAADLASQQTRIATLQRAHAQLRLYAPVTGHVKGLRKNAAGSVFFDGAALFEIAPTGVPEYEIDFILPQRFLKKIPLNTGVTLSVKGLTQAPPPLIGTIRRYSYVPADNSSQHVIYGHIRLNDVSIAALQDNTFGLARLSDNVAMAVNITILRESILTEILHTTLDQGQLAATLNRFAGLKESTADLMDLNP